MLFEKDVSNILNMKDRTKEFALNLPIGIAVVFVLGIIISLLLEFLFNLSLKDAQVIGFSISSYIFGMQTGEGMLVKKIIKKKYKIYEDI